MDERLWNQIEEFAKQESRNELASAAIWYFTQHVPEGEKAEWVEKYRRWLAEQIRGEAASATEGGEDGDEDGEPVSRKQGPSLVDMVEDHVLPLKSLAESIMCVSAEIEEHGDDAYAKAASLTAEVIVNRCERLQEDLDELVAASKRASAA